MTWKLDERLLSLTHARTHARTNIVYFSVKDREDRSLRTKVGTLEFHQYKYLRLFYSVFFFFFFFFLHKQTGSSAPRHWLVIARLVSIRLQILWQDLTRFFSGVSIQFDVFQKQKNFRGGRSRRAGFGLWAFPARCWMGTPSSRRRPLTHGGVLFFTGLCVAKVLVSS